MVSFRGGDCLGNGSFFYLEKIDVILCCYGRYSQNQHDCGNYFFHKCGIDAAKIIKKRDIGDGSVWLVCGKQKSHLSIL